VSSVIERDKDRLSVLDGEIGDGDHGVTMAMGWNAVAAQVAQLPAESSIQQICNSAAKAFITVGGSAGPLWATALMRGGASAKDKQSLDRDGFVAFLAAACRGMEERGKAQRGDKTMLDAFLPAVEAAEAAKAEGRSLAECLDAAASAAEAGAAATAQFVAKLGRASRLGERSLGHVDPGAASAALIIRALANGVKDIDVGS
jgi:dihydroxyacetone kinase-like protein